MPEATSVKGPGWYMSVIMDSQNWHWWKLYTGQSEAVCRRVRSHYAEKSDGHGIFHRLWSALPTRMAWFFSLGSCDQASSGFHPNDLGLWLNIVEKFFALGFQTLPTSTLSTMAPPYWKRLSEVGINTSDPLDQGHRFAAKQFVDPELGKLYWYRGMCISRGMRKAACDQKHLGKLWRDADPAQGDTASLLVYCRGCEIDEDPQPTEFLNRMPRHEVSTGAYVADIWKNDRTEHCKKCIGKGRIGTQFFPVNPDICYVTPNYKFHRRPTPKLKRLPPKRMRKVSKVKRKKNIRSCSCYLARIKYFNRFASA